MSNKRITIRSKGFSLTVVFMIIFFGGCSENTRYSKSFDKKAFEEIKLGGDVGPVVDNLGPPISVYYWEMKSGKAVSHPTVTSLEEMNSDPVSGSRYYRLFYTEQINTRRSYLHAHISVVNGKVVEKSLQKITE